MLALTSLLLSFSSSLSLSPVFTGAGAGKNTVFPVVPGAPGSSAGASGKNDLFMMKRQRDVCGGRGGRVAAGQGCK